MRLIYVELISVPGLLKFSKGGKNFETIVGDISEYRDDKNMM